MPVLPHALGSHLLAGRLVENSSLELAELDAVTPGGPQHKPVGWSALHMLANRPDKWGARGRLAKALLDSKADPMRLTARETTPLHTAAATNNRSVAEVLLGHGVDVDAKNKDRRTPLDVQSNKAMKALLKEFGAEPSDNPTGKSSRDEAHARPRGVGASASRQERSRSWREAGGRPGVGCG